MTRADLFPTAVYRLFDSAGTLLYVGMGDARVRIVTHLRKQPWCGEIDLSRTTVEWFAARTEAARRELAAIRSERPKYNIVGAEAGYAQQRRRHACVIESKPFITRHYVGAGEIRGRLGVSNQRVQQLINEPGWPAPYDEIAAGRIWLKQDIEAWIADNRPELIVA